MNDQRELSDVQFAWTPIRINAFIEILPTKFKAPEQALSDDRADAEVKAPQLLVECEPNPQSNPQEEGQDNPPSPIKSTA